MFSAIQDTHMIWICTLEYAWVLISSGSPFLLSTPSQWLFLPASAGTKPGSQPSCLTLQTSQVLSLSLYTEHPKSAFIRISLIHACTHIINLPSCSSASEFTGTTSGDRPVWTRLLLHPSTSRPGSRQLVCHWATAARQLRGNAPEFPLAPSSAGNSFCPTMVQPFCPQPTGTAFTGGTGHLLQHTARGYFVF